MNKVEYEIIRSNLVSERKRLMECLEKQGDFPQEDTLLAYEINKRAIIDLDYKMRGCLAGDETK